MNRTYRFFFHYYKQKGKMSVHFKKQCTVIKDIDCRVPVETKYNKTQPRLIMRGFCKEIIIDNDRAIII